MLCISHLYGGNQASCTPGNNSRDSGYTLCKAVSIHNNITQDECQADWTGIGSWKINGVSHNHFILETELAS